MDALAPRVPLGARGARHGASARVVLECGSNVPSSFGPAALGMRDALQVLLVEGEDSMRRFLRAALTAERYRVLEATTAAEGLRLAASHNPDVVMLGLGPTDLDSVEVTRRLRAWTQVPIIVLSTGGQQQDEVEALDAGADDYLAKPFGLQELLARVRVALRHGGGRGRGPTGGVFVAGRLQVDVARRRVVVEERPVRLTPLEYKLLVVLVRHAGKVLVHQQLLEEVWGPGRAGQTQYLHVYMGHLRNKLEVDPARPQLLVTVPGVGYCLHTE